MKSFIQQEFNKILEQKVVYSIRLYLQILGFLLLSQLLNEAALRQKR